MKLYTSRYICDVMISKESICLTDTKYQKLYVDTNDTEVIKQFKDWFVNFYCKGKSMSPTVVMYEKRPSEDNGEVLLFIKLFLTTS